MAGIKKPSFSWRGIGQTAVTVALLLLMIWLVGADPIVATVRQADRGLLLLSLLLTPLVMLFKVWRWHLLANSVAPVSWGQAWQSYLAGLALAVITPLAAGEAGRGLFVPGGDKAALTGKFLIDKGIDLSAVALFSAVGLLLVGEIDGHPVQGWGLLLLAGVVVGWIALFQLLPWLRRTVGRRVALLDKGLAALAETSRNQWLANCLLAFIGFIIFYLQAFVLLRAMWPAAPIETLPTFPLITLSTLIPIAVGGLGIREWTAVLLLNRFGIPAEAAATAFFTHFIVVLFLPALIGAATISRGWSRKA